MAKNGGPGPWRRAVRYTLEAVGRVLLGILSRTTVTGADRVPTRGPLIIAGNHRAVMEVFLMLEVTRPHVELIGSGDFPLDPRFRFLADWYGYIPYKRGSVDSRALKRALGVLRRGGVVGIFPEGGIWTEGPKETQRGVAWLASQSGAPVLPIGFGGIDAGVEKLMMLRFPRFETHVGTLERFPAGRPTRTSLDEFSTRIMNQIDGLIPDWDKEIRPTPTREEFRLILRAWSATDARRADVAPSEETVRTDARAEALARFFHFPVLLSIFRINLMRNVDALEAWNAPVIADELARACARVLGYLELRNRFLITYRLGQEQGTLVAEAIREMRDWAREREGMVVQIVPVRTVTWPDGRVEVNATPE